MIKIISGSLRGRIVKIPEVGSRCRPTSGVVRSAVFSTLASMDLPRGARVLDLFAGSGSLGFEALSRGASSVTFVESDQVLARALQENIAALEVGESAQVVGSRVESFVKGNSFVEGSSASSAPQALWQLVFVDPPYRSYGLKELLQLVMETGIELGGVVVYEAERDCFVGEEGGRIGGFVMDKVRRYGDTEVHYLRRVV